VRTRAARAGSRVTKIARAIEVQPVWVRPSKAMTRALMAPAALAVLVAMPVKVAGPARPEPPVPTANSELPELRLAPGKVRHIRWHQVPRALTATTAAVPAVAAAAVVVTTAAIPMVALRVAAVALAVSEQVAEQELAEALRWRFWF
jgi:hypothetical protein